MGSPASHYLFALLLLLPALTKAQTKDDGATADTEALHLQAQVDGRGRMVVLHWSEGERRHRHVLPLDQLVAAPPAWTDNDRVLRFQCQEAHPRCITSEDFLHSTVKRRSTLDLPLDPEGPIAGIVHDRWGEWIANRVEPRPGP